MTLDELQPLKSEQEELEAQKRREEELNEKRKLEEEEKKKLEEEHKAPLDQEKTVTVETKDSKEGKEIDEEDDDDDYEDIESEGSERNVIDDEDDDRPINPDDEDEEEITESREEESEGSEDEIEEEEEKESPPNKKPLDDDEDKRKPQYIPKRGAFYEHDDRLGPEEDSDTKGKEEGTVEEREGKEDVLKISSVSSVNRNNKTVKEDVSSGKQTFSNRIETERWGHDMFDENEQQPKSREELLSSYGYDIRSDDSKGIPNKLRKPKNQLNSQQKYTSRSFSKQTSSSKTAASSNELQEKETIVVNRVTTGNKANDKIAMREAHQENERKRYNEERKQTTDSPKDSLSRENRRRNNRTDADGGGNRNQRRINNDSERGMRSGPQDSRYQQRDQRRGSDQQNSNRRRQQHQEPSQKFPNRNTSTTVAPYNQEDFPELSPSSQKVVPLQQTSQAWNRHHYHHQRHQREDSSDDSQERKGQIKTMVFGRSGRRIDPNQPKDQSASQSFSNESKDSQRRSDRDQSHRQNQPPSASHQDNRDLREILQEKRRNEQQQRTSQPQGRQGQQFDQQSNRSSEDRRGSDRRGDEGRDQRGNNRRQDRQQGTRQPKSGAGQQRQQFEPSQQYSSEQANYIKELAAGVQNMTVDPSTRGQKQPLPQSLSNSSSARGSIDMTSQMEVSDHRPKRYSAQRQQPVQRDVVNNNNVIHGPSMNVPLTMNPLPPQQQYYDPVPQSPPEYYQDPNDSTPYTAYASDGYPLHNPRAYITTAGHQGVPTPPLNPSSMTGMMTTGSPGPPPSFMPTFTPSLPPSGFPQYPPPAPYHSLPPGVGVTSTGMPGINATSTTGIPTGPGVTPTATEILRGGVTYYDTSQQQPPRSLPPKRQKNIIPIVPPPGSSSSEQQADHHQQQDSYTTGY